MEWFGNETWEGIGKRGSKWVGTNWEDTMGMIKMGVGAELHFFTSSSTVNHLLLHNITSYVISTHKLFYCVN